MLQKYDHKTIEPKWQKHWEDTRAFHAADDAAGRENFYLLVEFPYPSGNLHVGHWYAFAMPDIFARFQRMRGRNVLFPIGFDAFGLPAENAALKRGINPRTWTHDNIDYMRQQLKRMGASFDWTREVVTCEPAYYRWTQWIFLAFFKAGLAYQAEVAVNWCPSCKTVLANEQVREGKCERCENAVEQRKMKQWLLKIKDFAEELLQGLDRLAWPEEICSAQRNWIGRSEGITIQYQVEGSDDAIVVFTTRPDTNFGATCIVLAPEHEFIARHLEEFPHQKDVEAYVGQTMKKTELERMAEGRKKTGAFTGWYAFNDLNQKKMPIYVADFVLASVGTGAVVGVPGHDMRDFEFAQAMGLEVVRVVVGPDGDASPITRPEQVQEEKGVMINSDFLNGLAIHDAIEKMKDYLEEKGRGKRVVIYKLRDWLISRQRYWGCPIPVIHCQACGAVPVPEKDLPLALPALSDYQPRSDGKSPLAKLESWARVPCPQCGADAERETDTLDTFIDSSWYFLRYCDPANEKEFAAKKTLSQWMPIDLYSGGAEHTTMHLLYSRFWIKAMHRLGLVLWDEPYTRRMNRGVILGPDGQKMSKSHGNVIDPDEQVVRLGADTVRLYLAFIGPYSQVGAYPWSIDGIVGMRRFLERAWTVVQGIRNKEQGTHSALNALRDNAPLTCLAHETIKKVTEDIEAFKFNTAIAQLMTYTNALAKADRNDPAYTVHCSLLTVLLSPFAPHIAEELWERSGHTHSIAEESWPQFDAAVLIATEAHVVVQVNGKKRALVTVAASASEGDVIAAAEALPDVRRHVQGKKVAKRVYVKGKLINLVTRD